MPVFPELTEEERWRSTFALVPPTLCFGTAPDQCFFFLVAPEDGRTRSTSRSATCSTRPPSRTRMFEHKLALSDAGVQVFVRQDQDATTKVQRGLRQPVRAARPLLVAGGEPRPVQPLARAALPASTGPTSTASTDHQHHGLTISGAGRHHEKRRRRRSPALGSAALFVAARAAATSNDAAATPRPGSGRRPPRPRLAERRRRRLRPRRAPATTAAAPAASTDALATLDTNGDGKVVFGVAARRPARRRRLLPGARRRRHEVLRGQRLRDAGRGRQHPGRRRRDRSWTTWPGRTSTSSSSAPAEIADPLPALIAEYPRHLWYCNCGAGFQERAEAADPDRRRRLARSATGGLRHRPPHEGRRPDEGRVHRQQRLQLREGGLPGVRARPAGRRPELRVDLRRAPGNFDDVDRGQREAFNNLLAQGVRAVYPYLGGAHEAVVSWPTRRATSSS